MFVYSIVTGQLWRRSSGKIADAPFIDHENLDKQNNCWLNIRDCTKTQNQGNRGARADNQCGFKGIHWDGTKGMWVVQIKRSDERYMRRTRTLAGAIALHRLRSCEMYGEFARTA